MKTLLAGLLLSTSASAHLLPDLITAKDPLNDWKIVREDDCKFTLRLSNGVANIGNGPLEIYAGEVDEDGRQKVYQRIYVEDGSSYSQEAGTFTYHPEHGHTHFDDFAAYRLRKVVGRNGVGQVVAESAKVSFCLWDDSVYRSNSGNRRYTSCGSEIQGISVGWQDVYDKSLAGQSMDITDVEPGTYWLESEADPFNRIEETNENNNVTRIKITIPY